MKKRNNLKTNHDQSQASFFRVDVTDKDSIMAASSALDSYQLVERTSAARDTFKNIESNTHVRDQFRRGDYDYFRSSEGIPHRQQDIIAMCMQAYRKVGLIRNIIDLMADFGAEGIKLIHPNPRIQKFYRGWFKRVGGPERSERFLNLLYRSANVIVNRSMAQIDLKSERRMKALGVDERLSPDIEPDPHLEPLHRNIPFRYIFLNPLTLEILGEEISQFVGKQAYAIKLGSGLRRAVSSPQNEMERELIKALPSDLRNAILDGQMKFPLDSTKVSAYFYKKDDWQPWADPLVFAVLDDIMLLEKMKLADVAALDGAISQVRLWKLGDLDKEIFPTDAAVNRLADILLSNPGGGAFDLIWGPELTLEESGSDVHQFLGKTKYEPVLNSIYAGLGVPPTLTGAATASGFTNNYISLKTLVQRLEYGRSILQTFWDKEIDLVRQAMGFQRPARVVFGHMTLRDDAAEKALLIQLADRDLMSIDTIQERFGEIPEIENLKLRREHRLRKNQLLSNKAGPYHTAEQTHERITTALGRGYISPEQAGIEIPVELQDDVAPFDKQLEAQIKMKAQQGGPSSKTSKSKGQPQQGRPRTSRNKPGQKTRTPKPIGASVSDDTIDFLSALLWAKEAQSNISTIVTPAILKHFGKSNLRSLSAKEVARVEKIKFQVLSHILPYAEVSQETVVPILQAEPSLDKCSKKVYDCFYAKLVAIHEREPTIEELRLIQASTYATVHSGLAESLRAVAWGYGDTEAEALSDATNNAYRTHSAISIINTRFQKSPGSGIYPDSYTCLITYEYTLNSGRFAT